MKLLLSLFLTGACASAVAAQSESNWTHNGLFQTNLSQVSLKNWSAGGENNVGIDVLFTYSLDYKKDKTIWQNRLEMNYGMNDMETTGTRKTNDKIYLSSNYGREIADALYFSSLLTFQTQFDEGFNYNKQPYTLISKFMSPGYLTVGLGLTWTPEPCFKATYTPATWRGTFVLDDGLSAQGAFGVDAGDHLHTAIGSNLKMEYEQEVIENVKIYSRLELFSDYLDHPGNVDVAWDVQVNMSVNKWLTTNISTNLIYDNDIKLLQNDGSRGPRTQFKEALSVGFKVNF